MSAARSLPESPAGARAPCPACGDRRARPLERVELDDQHEHYAPRDRSRQQELTAAAREAAVAYDMYECSGCELQFAWPLRNPGSRWYALAYRTLQLYPSERWEFARVAGRLPRGARVLEIGCGAGRFLEACAAAGLAATGLDFSADAIHRCRAKGLDARPLALGAGAMLPIEHCGAYDAVAAFHVLEHLDDPRRFFQIAATSTAARGELLVSVPSDRRISRLHGERDVLDQPPHHLTRWTPRALGAIGAVCGWRLDDLEYEPLSPRVALWSTAVRLPAYRAAHARARSRVAERALRWALYPRAALRLAAQDPAPSGFSMLARFTRAD